MFDAIFIGTSGLQTFSAGLKVISNNVTNLNTPGFKSADAQFSNLYQADSGSGSGQLVSSGQRFGSGVMAGETLVNFQPGEMRQTGNPLDLSVNGEGFFITQEPGSNAQQAEYRYTRAGQFEFDKDGRLVVRGTDKQVVGLDDKGAQTPITLDGLRIQDPKPTSTVTLTGNLSSSATEVTVSTVKVIDAIGGEHVLKLVFKPKAGNPGSWTVAVFDGATEVASGDVSFVDGRPANGSDSFSFSYTPPGVKTTSVKVELSKNATSFDTGAMSSLALGSVDGYSVGSLTKVSFDADGVMSLSYSNGQSSKGPRIALAVFDTNGSLTPIGNNEFGSEAGQGLHIGAANQGIYGGIGSSQIEGSNVDLATEFSDLIVTQRGYQAASRIVSTANELLQDLYDMKGHR